jgi:hypothetical protein
MSKPAFAERDKKQTMIDLRGISTNWFKSPSTRFSRLQALLKPVLRIRIRIHRIHMFLGLPDPDPLVRGMDPDPDPSIIMQK